MDKIHLNDISGECVIGVFPEERSAPQTVMVSMTLCADLSKASVSDDIRDTIDYFDLAVRIKRYIADSSFRLLESLAEGISRIALEEGAAGVKVVVWKPRAMESAEARIEIIRGDYG